MTPIKRLREAVEQFGRAGTLVVETDDLRALLALVEAAQGIQRYPPRTVSHDMYLLRLDAALAVLERDGDA